MKTVKENCEIISNGQVILLEKGDKISIIEKSKIDDMKKQYNDAVASGDTEEAERLAIKLTELGVKK